MTAIEMQENFSKIGDSEKLTRAIQHPEIIGRFGIGFLSSFIVADRVTVLTRKFGQAATYFWETNNKSKWTITEAKGLPSGHNHGTIVRLYFKDAYPSTYAERVNDLKTVDGVEKIVHTYCHLIPYPIVVGLANEAGRRANAQRPPWSSDEEAKECYKVLFSRNEPMFIYRFDERDPGTSYQARGVIYFAEQIIRVPSLQLYVKRMLVNPEDSKLVPPYGVFASGIVDCPQLQVDLARRQVSPFDPTYKWLRRTTLRLFEAAFIKFATLKLDEFCGLWPKVDNSFISHLAESHRSEDADLQAAAESFLIKAGRHIPFYEVDLISGSQGRPLWRTIHEAVERRKRQLDNSSAAAPSGMVLQDERMRVKVFYTASQQPVEKDILLNQYGELIDVGRSEKAHELAMRALTSLNDRFEDFVLEEVKASRFNEMAEMERQRWVEATGLVKRGMVFFNKSHEVVAEQFEPISTPVVITDTNVDPEALTSLREQLAKAGGMTSGLSQQLVGFLDGLAAKGGALTVHLNASNAVLQKLRDGLDATAPEVKQVAGDGLKAIAWRAVLDYFGWNSTRDMIARDRTYTHTIIEQLVDTSQREVLQQDELAKANSELADSKSRLESARREVAVIPNRRLEVICGFVDIVDSTSTLIANARVGPPEAAEAIRAIVQELEKQIRKMNATPVSFTGDGLLFFWERLETTKPNVRATLHHLEGAVEIASQENSPLRALLKKMAIEPPKLRVALAFGDVYQGQVGPTVNLIGLPVVEAARIAALKDSYEAAKASLLITSEAHDNGAAWGMWRAVDFQPINDVELRGTNRRVGVCKPAWR